MNIFFLIVIFFLPAFLLNKGIAQNTGKAEAIKQLLDTTGNSLPQNLGNTQKALQLAKREGIDMLQGRAFLQMGQLLQFRGKYTQASSYFDSARTVFLELNRNEYLTRTNYRIGSNHIYLGKFELAEETFSRALTKAELMSDSTGMGRFLRQLSVIYLKRNQLNIAQTYYQRALKIAGQLEDSLLTARCHRLRGLIAKRLQKPYEAIEYFSQAVQLFRFMDYNRGIALISNDYGEIYRELNEFEKALEYFRQSLRIAQNSNYYAVIAENLKSMGDLYQQQGALEKAGNYYSRALEILRGVESQYQLAHVLLQMGELHNKKKEYQQAAAYLKESIANFHDATRSKFLIEAYRELATSYSKTGDYRQAFVYLNRYTQQHDSLFENEQEARVKEIEELHLEEKREQRLKLQDAQLARKNAELEHQDARQNALMASIIIMVLLVGFITFFYIQKRNSNRAFREKNRRIEQKNLQLNQKNEEITAQRDEIMLQRDEIIKQKNEIEKQRDEIDRQRNTLLWQTKEITDSILYARYIQHAMLPAHAIFDDNLKDYFLYYKPRDIVSGDFYWAKRVNQFTYIAAVDCSGHGVPGAFMSMLGFAFLNEIVNYKHPLHTNQVMDELRATVKDALGHTDAKEGVRDGMSVALCRINHEHGTMEFSGAFNPLYQFRNGELIKHQADRQPVAIYFNEKPFTRKTITYQQDDRFYIFTDGYSDQFGGPNGKKYKKKTFQHLLTQIHQEPMAVQKEAINRELTEWMNGDYYQVDDILVIGFQII